MSFWKPKNLIISLVLALLGATPALACNENSVLEQIEIAGNGIAYNEENSANVVENIIKILNQCNTEKTRLAVIAWAAPAITYNWEKPTIPVIRSLMPICGEDIACASSLVDTFKKAIQFNYEKSTSAAGLAIYEVTAKIAVPEFRTFAAKALFEGMNSRYREPTSKLIKQAVAICYKYQDCTEAAIQQFSELVNYSDTEVTFPAIDGIFTLLKATPTQNGIDLAKSALKKCISANYDEPTATCTKKLVDLTEITSDFANRKPHLETIFSFGNFLNSLANSVYRFDADYLRRLKELVPDASENTTTLFIATALIPYLENNGYGNREDQNEALTTIRKSDEAHGIRSLADFEDTSAKLNLATQMLAISLQTSLPLQSESQKIASQKTLTALASILTGKKSRRERARAFFAIEPELTHLIIDLSKNDYLRARSLTDSALLGFLRGNY